MSRPKVVVTHWVHEAVLDALGAHAEVVANQTRETLPPEEIRARCRDAAGMVAFMPDTVDAAFLAACPDLRVVACALKGFDNFDVDACTRRGVWITAVPDLLTNPTAELAVGLLIGLARRIADGDRLVRGGGFAGWRPVLYGAGLDGAAAGIVGMGRVGRAIARRLAGFGPRLAYSDPAALPAADEAALGLVHRPLPELLEASDFVVVAAPLTPATLHLIDAAALGRMKPGAFLVNVGRGSVVDEAAVADALAAGRLAGYAADVYEFEDWARADRPRAVEPRLLSQPSRTLFTAHQGSAVDAVRRDIALAAARSVVQALAGAVPDGALNDVRRGAA